MKVPTYLGSLDERSFDLGMIYAFAETVASGCKPLAYSPPLEPAEVPAVLAAAHGIEQEFGVLIRHDTGFVPSLLFNPAFTQGKEVLVICRDQSVLQSYLTLQQRQTAAQSEPASSRSHVQMARDLGRLLGYTEDAIDGLLDHPRF